MKIENKIIKLINKIQKPEDVEIRLIQDNNSKWYIRWGGYSEIYLKGSKSSINLGLTEFIEIDDNSVVKFIDTDENNTIQQRGAYPLNLIEKIVLGI